MDDGFLRLARNVSFHSNHRVRIGAVIVKNGKPVSVGFNKLKTHPMYTRVNHRRAKYIQSLHAEMSALISARTDVSGATIFVYRERRDGSRGNAKPCPVCQMLLAEAGVKKIYFSTDNGIGQLYLKDGIYIERR